MAPTTPTAARRALAAACLLCAVTATLPARAQHAEAELADANQRAMQAYVDLQIDAARELLEHAIARAEADGAEADSRARTYMHLGIVYVGGLGDEEAGARVFREALLLEPDLVPEPSLSTPAVMRVYERARDEADREADRRALAAAAAYAAEKQRAKQAALAEARQQREKQAQQPAPAPVPQAPPEPEEPPPPVRLFLRLGFTVGSAYVSSGATPDKPPPVDFSDERVQAHNWDCPPDAQGNELDRSACSVGVVDAGFVPTYAVRGELGWHPAARVSLSGTLRIQLDAGSGSLARTQLGLRLSYLITQPSTTGLHAALFAGGTLGQIQPQPSPSTDDPKPYVTSGPLGASVGTTLGYRFSRHMGVHFTPEVMFLFPARLMNLDITAGPALWF